MFKRHVQGLTMLPNETIGKLEASGIPMHAQGRDCLTAFTEYMLNKWYGINQTFDAYQHFKAGWIACEDRKPRL